MDTRCINVQKDGLQFKIEIKPIGRYARNQRTSYIRGYKSSLLANRDIPRLKLHLKSKRAGAPERLVVPIFWNWRTPLLFTMCHHALYTHTTRSQPFLPVIVRNLDFLFQYVIVKPFMTLDGV